MPGDFLGRVAHEVDDVELAPEGLSDLIRNRVAENFERSGLAFGLRVFGRNGRVLALQHGEGRVIERFEKLGLPGRPDLGARRTDVGDGEKVKGVESRLGLDDVRESAHDLGVGDVALLGRKAHREVLPHEEGDEVCR